MKQIQYYILSACIIALAISVIIMSRNVRAFKMDVISATHQRDSMINLLITSVEQQDSSDLEFRKSVYRKMKELYDHENKCDSK